MPPVVVATADVTQANFHADLTTDNAFVELIGVDLTAYQTGKYLLGIYNKTDGYGMLGHISSVAPAGETLGAEIATGTLTIKNLYKITATEANHFFTGCAIGNYFNSLGTETCDANNKVKNVSDPPSTGARIVSTKGGAGRAWYYKYTSFNLNDKAGQTYKIYYLGD